MYGLDLDWSAELKLKAKFACQYLLARIKPAGLNVCLPVKAVKGRSQTKLLYL